MQKYDNSLLRIDFRPVMVVAFLLALAAAAIIAGAAARSAQAQSAPNIYLIEGDSHSSSPGLPGSCATVSGPASQVSYGDNADCMVVGISNPSYSYTDDFRVCYWMDANRAGNNILCTAWASQGGGGGGVYDNGNSFHTFGARVETRPTPVPGMYFTNVKIGIILYYQSNNGGCGDSSGIGWASANPGSGNQSPYWSYGAQKDDDPGCGAMFLSAQSNKPNHALFVSETIPDSASPDSPYTGNKIRMQNDGATWTADQSAKVSGDCSAFNPTTAGETCVEVYDVWSSNFKLIRKDSAPVNAPALLDFKKRISYTYTSYATQWCETFAPHGGSGGGGGKFPGGPNTAMQRSPRSLLSWARSWISNAQAQEEGPCYSTINIRVTPSGHANVEFGEQVDFPIDISTTTSAGVFNLQYRMIQLSNIPYGNAAGEFDDPAYASINVVGSSPGTYSLICSPTDIGTIGPGDPNPKFNVLASSNNGYNSNITLTASSSPAGLNFSFAANPINPAGTANTDVTVSGFQPNTTYAITVTDAVGGSCQTRLTVGAVPPTVITVTGRVYNPNTGTGFSNITLESCVEGQRNPVTDASGNFSFTVNRDAAYCARVLTPPAGHNGPFTNNNPDPQVGGQNAASYEVQIAGRDHYHSAALGPDNPSYFWDRSVDSGVDFRFLPMSTYSLLCSPTDLGTIAPGDPNPKFNVLAFSSNGYNGNVNLSATSSPGGLSFAFTTNPVNPSGASSTDVTVSGFQSGTTYTINVYGSPQINGGTPTCQTQLKITAALPGGELYASPNPIPLCNQGSGATTLNWRANVNNSVRLNSPTGAVYANSSRGPGGWYSVPTSAVTQGTKFYLVDEATGAALANTTIDFLDTCLPPSLDFISDSAGSNVSGTVNFSGWAMDNTTKPETAISRVELYVDETMIARLTPGNGYGSNRGDVCGGYPDRPGCPNVGFSTNWNSASVSNGWHAVKAIAYDTDINPKSAEVTKNYNVNNSSSGNLSCTPTDLGTVRPGDPNPRFNVYVSGSSGPVTVTAASSPGGLSFTYVTNPINSAGTASTDIIVSGMQPNTTYTITVSGSSSGGSSPSCGTIVRVGGTRSNASVNLYCSGDNTAYSGSGSCQVIAPGSGYLKWDSANASSCSMNQALLNYSTPATSPPAPSGNYVVPTQMSSTNGTTTRPFTAPGAYTFTITCQSNDGGNPATQSVTFNVVTSPALNTSAKSVVSVQSGGVTTQFNPAPCAAQSLNFSQLFKEGDIITFRVDLCNQGSADLNSDIVVTDTMSNVVKLPVAQGGWNASFQCGGQCTGTVDETGYDPTSNPVIRFRLTRIGAAGIPKTNGVWSVTYKAQVKAPTGGQDLYYRFRNCADISLSPAPNPPISTGSASLCTDPHLFGRTGAPADRHEIAP